MMSETTPRRAYKIRIRSGVRSGDTFIGTPTSFNWGGVVTTINGGTVSTLPDPTP